MARPIANAPALKTAQSAQALQSTSGPGRLGAAFALVGRLFREKPLAPPAR